MANQIQDRDGIDSDMTRKEEREGKTSSRLDRRPTKPKLKFRTGFGRNWLEKGVENLFLRVEIFRRVRLNLDLKMFF